MAEVIELQDDDDASFLELVAAAESEARVAKRHKGSASASAVVLPPTTEGPYMTALKGSRSSLWQQQQQQEIRPNQRKGRSGVGSITMGSNNASSTISSGGGTCFKCGVAGHWARDCTIATGNENAGGFTSARASSFGDDGCEVPEKACPCGSGSCLVRTSNTPKNPGRKFYRCPLKEENGGCNFFEWCDSSLKNVPATHASNYEPNSSVTDLSCPCGAGSCLVLVTKNGKNVGRQFYRCPAKEGSGYCGFFKWCDDQNSPTVRSAFIANKFQNVNYSSSQVYGETKGSCFKCGQEGHWSRDCPMQSSDGYASTRGNRPASSAPGTCFKCGRSGHWARDCTGHDLSVAKASGTVSTYNGR